MTTKNKIFGTDGIRGKAGISPMTSEISLAVGRAVAYKARAGSHRHKIVIGKDTRVSCYMVETALISGICSMGADAIMLGPIPTAGVAYLTKDMRADAGIMITASHNPFYDNGIKIFNKDGFKLSDEQEQEIEDYVLQGIQNVDVETHPTAELVGRAFKMEDARGRYIAHVKSVFPGDLDLCGMKIALDCANGAAYKVAPAIFSELGAEVFVVGNKPNGTNINENCGAIHTDFFAQQVAIEKCDLGLSFDGDSDRVVIVDETGTVVHGDAVLAIAAKELIERDGPRPIVATIMSNMALDNFVQNIGGWVKRVDVGDRYVIEEMRKTKCSLGGEQSGHIIYSDHSTTGDGMVAALKLIVAMKRGNKKISELAKILQPYPQILLNIDVDYKKPIEEIPELQNAINDACRATYGDGRVLVRYSGTENKLRIMVEHKEETLAQELVQLISDAAWSIRKI
jgi:phosphoglucosamine mutase